MNASARFSLIAAVIAGLIVIIVATVLTTSWLVSGQQKVVYVAPAPPPPPTSVQQARTDLTNGGVQIARKQDAPEMRSPFSDVRWKGSTPQVQVNHQWYELVAMDNVPAAQIVDFAKKNFGDPWKQRIAQFPAALLTYMNHPVGSAVNLQLKTLDSGEAVALANVPMTTANAMAIHRQPGGGSPFSGVKWNGDAAQVQVNGNWYDLIALNDVPAAQIVEFAKTTYGDEDRGGQPLWRKRFSEDLGQVMSRMGHEMGETVNLQLRNLKTSETVSLSNVAITESNRDSILAQRNVTNP